MGNLSKETLENLLAVIILLEHKIKHGVEHEIKHEQYWAIVHLCQACNAPQFVTEYFARKGAITKLEAKETV